MSAWPVENKQYHVNTSYGETFVIESGEKNNPPLLLIHGSVSNSFSWFGDFIPLSHRFNVYAVDIIGEAGFSAPERPEYRSGAYAKWLKEAIQNLGLKSTSIAGLSLGGWMALDVSTKFPELVDKLILLCPGGLARVRPNFIWKVLFYSLMGNWGQKKILSLINGGKAPDSLSPEMKKAMEFTLLISRNFNPRKEKLPIFDRNKLSELSMPVLLVFGDKDYLLNATKSVNHLKKWVPSATINILQDTGHAVVGQSNRIADFLTK